MVRSRAWTICFRSAASVRKRSNRSGRWRRSVHRPRRSIDSTSGRSPKGGIAIGAVSARLLLRRLRQRFFRPTLSRLLLPLDEEVHGNEQSSGQRHKANERSDYDHGVVIHASINEVQGIMSPIPAAGRVATQRGDFVSWWPIRTVAIDRPSPMPHSLVERQTPRCGVRTFQFRSSMKTESRTPRMLIIEDDPEVGSGLEDYFEMRGFEVSRAADGDRGLQLITTLPEYDIVLLDVMLPKKDGFEVLR